MTAGTFSVPLLETPTWLSDSLPAAIRGHNHGLQLPWTIMDIGRYLANMLTTVTCIQQAKLQHTGMTVMIVQRMLLADLVKRDVESPAGGDRAQREQPQVRPLLQDALGDGQRHLAPVARLYIGYHCGVGGTERSWSQVVFAGTSKIVHAHAGTYQGATVDIATVDIATVQQAGQYC